MDAAPVSAVLGDVDTIDVSWSGLSFGTTYLGAISHIDDGGLMGFTLFDVETQ